MVKEQVASLIEQEVEARVAILVARRTTKLNTRIKELTAQRDNANADRIFLRKKITDYQRTIGALKNDNRYRKAK